MQLAWPASINESIANDYTRSDAGTKRDVMMLSRFSTGGENLKMIFGTLLTSGKRRLLGVHD